MTGIALSSGVRRVGALRTSNQLVNTLMDNVYRTQRANFMDVPTDCPQRDERLGWLGDGQVSTRICIVVTHFKWMCRFETTSSYAYVCKHCAHLLQSS